MKIKLLKNYQLSERGMIVDFPDGIAGDLVRRNIAEYYIEKRAVIIKKRGRSRTIKC